MPFLHNLDPHWLEAEYRRWLQEPDSFAPEWQRFFEGFELGRTPPPAELHADLPEAMLQSGVQSLIYRYRDLGHLLACTDPLSPCPLSHPLLDLAAFGLTTDDLDRHFHIRRFMKETATLREILETMQGTYCRSIGVEFMYIQEPAERQWLIDRMEPVQKQQTAAAGRAAAHPLPAAAGDAVRGVSGPPLSGAEEILPGGGRVAADCP